MKQWSYAAELMAGDKVVLSIHGLRTDLEVVSVQQKRLGAVNYWLLTGRRLSGEIMTTSCSTWEHVRHIRALRD